MYKKFRVTTNFTFFNFACVDSSFDTSGFNFEWRELKFYSYKRICVVLEFERIKKMLINSGIFYNIDSSTVASSSSVLNYIPQYESHFALECPSNKSRSGNLCRFTVNYAIFGVSVESHWWSLDRWSLILLMNTWIINNRF